MKKLLLLLLFVLFSTEAKAATTWYLCSGGGNFNGASVWTSVIGDQTGCTGATGNPVAGDTAILNSTSGNITITAAAAAATLNMTGYTGTLAVGAQTLTLTAGATLQGAFSASTGIISISGGGVTLAATPTGTTFPTIKLITASQTLTSGGFLWPGPLNFDFVGTFTFNGNWYTGGLTSLSLTPLVFNHTTTETYTAAGGLSGNALVSGNLTQLYLEGGTWSSGGFQPIEVPMTITPSVGNITISGLVTFGGTSNTLTYTSSTGTVTTTGSTLALSTVTTGITLNISGLTLGNLFLSNVGVSVALPSTLTLTGTLSSSQNSFTFTGITTLNCANFVNTSLTADGSFIYTFPAGATINVSNSLFLQGAVEYNGSNSPLIIKSGTASSPIYINYSGTAANAVVSNTSFTDVQFTGLPVYDYSQTSNTPTLLRTTGVTLVTPANVNISQMSVY